MLSETGHQAPLVASLTVPLLMQNRNRHSKSSFNFLRGQNYEKWSK